MSIVLEKYFSPKSIQLAYYRVKCWSDKTVKDQVGIRAFGYELEKNCDILSRKIIAGNYKPQRGFKFYAPKPSKTLRTKTLLYIEDALVYQAIANKIAEQNYDSLSQFNSFVFGSVLAPDVKKGTALLQEEEPNYFFFQFWKSLYKKFQDSVIESIEEDKVEYKFETDITGFFDSIPHFKLLSVMSEKFSVEDQILDILSTCFNIWSGTRDSITAGVGIPQGTQPSFLLANLLLHELDEALISDAFKYYRYMDDINIYGYAEKDLLRALLVIDKYTKGCGLSINAKKTSIEEISAENDATLKELRKIDFFSLSEEDSDASFFQENSPDKEIKSKVKRNAARLSEQDGADGEQGQVFVEIKTLTNDVEIIDFWQDTIKEVIETVPSFFQNPKNSFSKLKLKADVEDIDFVKMSAKYGTSINALNEIGISTIPDESLLKYWLFAYKHFFWRANLFNYTLMNYRDNQFIKKKLTEFISDEFELFEWARYFLLMNISLSQTFTDQELRQIFFPLLKAEESDLAKISYYRLLYKHAKNQQLRDTISNNLKKEDNNYLKLLIADFNKNALDVNVSINDFLNSIGL
jgi:retron-type reverse transcriptase